MKPKYTIHIYHDPPPIPTRECDYQASIDGLEEEGSGLGRTAPEALRDMADKLEMYLERLK